MKLKNALFLTLLLITGVLSSCRGQIDSKNEEQQYEFRSIAVEYKIQCEGNGSKKTGTKSFWVDNYGLNQATFLKETTSISMLGQTSAETSETLTILDGDMVYNINLIDKTGTKQSMEAFKTLGLAMATQIGITARSTREFVEANGGKWLESSTYLGKKCDVMDLLGVKQWLYKGIVLKTESNIMGMNYVEAAVSIDENIAIPSSRFEIPKGIAITDAGQIMGELSENETESPDIPSGKIGLGFDRFGNAAKKVSQPGYKMLSCINDQGLYMASFFKTETEAFGVYAHPAQMFANVSKGGEGGKIEKTFSVNGHKALLLSMEEEGESSITRAIAILYPEHSMTLMIAGSINIPENTFISIVNQMNL